MAINALSGIGQPGGIGTTSKPREGDSKEEIVAMLLKLLQEKESQGPQSGGSSSGGGCSGGCCGGGGGGCKGGCCGKACGGASRAKAVA